MTTIPRMVIHCSMEISVWINSSAFLSIFHHMNIHQKFTFIQANFKTKRNETKFVVKLSYLFNGSNGRLTEFIPICDCIEKVQCCILPKITTMNIDCRSCQQRAREKTRQMNQIAQAIPIQWMWMSNSMATKFKFKWTHLFKLKSNCQTHFGNNVYI